MPFIAIALVLTATLGGAVSVASQNALPGDALYGFKVGVNENIQSSLAFDDKSKADFNIAKAEIRLEEAAKLSSEGRLDANAQARIEQNFEAHAKNTATLIAKLQEKGDYAIAADVAARFQASVAKQASALAQAKASANAEGETTLTILVNRVHATLDIASDLSAEASAKASVESSVKASANTNGAAATSSSNTTVNVGATGSASSTGGINIDL
jgi:hypothetical protein